MNSKLVLPNGQPVPRQIRIEPEQSLAVGGKLIEAQVNELMMTFKLPQPFIAETLIKIAAALVAPAQPMQSRQVLQEQLVMVFRSEIARISSDLALQTGLPNQAVLNTK